MPTSTVQSFKLILPGFMSAFGRNGERLAALERLVAYGSPERCSQAARDHDCWQRELLSMLGVSSPGNYPSAALTRAGQGGDVVQGTWLHVDPARMEMSVDGLTVHASSAFTREQLAALTAILRKHLAEEAIDFDVVDTSMYLHTQESIDVTTTSLQRADGLSMREVLPAGSDAARLRRLMTEIQMLLQEVLGDGAAPNAVWLWGQGFLSAARRIEFPMLFANEGFARGIYLVHEQNLQVRAQPASFDAIAPLQRDAVVVIRVDRATPPKEIEDRWFVPVLKALHRGEIRSVELGLDGISVRSESSLWKRMVARPRALGEVLA